MKRTIISLLIIAGVLLPVQLPAVARVADSILLSRLVWGMSSDRIAQALKLDRNQYTILHDPSDMRITIFQSDGKPFNFPEFRIVYLNFDPEAGLFKINGFYNGTVTDVVAALKQRYGEPDLAKTSGLIPQYQWEFDDTALSILGARFEILPKQ
jgi:hypothetical protein